MDLSRSLLDLSGSFLDLSWILVGSCLDLSWILVGSSLDLGLILVPSWFALKKPSEKQKKPRLANGGSKLFGLILGFLV